MGAAFVLAECAEAAMAPGFFASLLHAATVSNAATMAAVMAVLVVLVVLGFMSADRLLVGLGEQGLHVLVEVGGLGEVGDVEETSAIRDDLAHDGSMHHPARQ